MHSNIIIRTIDMLCHVNRLVPCNDLSDKLINSACICLQITLIDSFNLDYYIMDFTCSHCGSKFTRTFEPDEKLVKNGSIYTIPLSERDITIKCLECGRDKLVGKMVHKLGMD